MSLMLEGFPTLLNIVGLSLGTKLSEKEVTGMGIDGGGGHDTSTMRNRRKKTKYPGSLSENTPLEFTAAYDPLVLAELEAIVLINDFQSMEWPDAGGTRTEFWGFLDKVKTNPCKENDQPTMSLTVVISNQDNAGNEVAPSTF